MAKRCTKWACPGTGGIWAWLAVTLATTSVPWWPIPMCQSMKVRSFLATCGPAAARPLRRNSTNKWWPSTSRRKIRSWPANIATSGWGRCTMAKGMFVDVSLCIGCKACQVACKEWNGLDGEPEHFAEVDGTPKAVNFTGNSYDNTGKLSATNWRHVRFIELIDEQRTNVAWRMMSDSCKHCVQAGCLEVCPTHALIRTSLGNV